MHGTALREGVTLALRGSYAWDGLIREGNDLGIMSIPMYATALSEGVTLVLCGSYVCDVLYVKVWTLVL